MNFARTLCFFAASTLFPIAIARIGEPGEVQRRLFIDDGDMEFERSGQMAEAENDRQMKIAKYRWPECKSMSAVACKELIDNDIMTLNTGVHTTIRSVIIDKRNNEMKWYNAVAIPIWSNGWAAGRNGDGLIKYDFPWMSAEEPVTPDEDKNIPLVEVDPDTKEPVQITGATLEDHLAGVDNRPICGGNFDPNAESTSDGKNKLAKELNTKRELLHKGVHELGPWDCSGMSGVDCCIMIKHEVRTLDEHGHAIQCYLDYKPGTRAYYEQQYNHRVRIYANHLGKVSQTPALG